MTTVAAVASTNDAYLLSSSTSYSSALSGSNLTPSSSADTSLYIGQQKSGSTYSIWQSFVEFGFTATAITNPVTAHIRLYSAATTGTAVDRGLDIQTFDWGGSVTAADWRTPSQLALALGNRVASLNRIQGASTGLALRAGVNNVALYDSSGTYRYVIEGTRNRLQNTPSGLEYNTFRSGDYQGGSTGFSPTLLVGELQNSLLSRALGAQVQLSDGSHMYLEFSNAINGTDDNTLIRRTTAGATTTIATATGQTQPRRGAQAYAMCRDKSDNVYVINQSDTSNGLNCRVFTKSGSVWNAGTLRTGLLPTYGGEPNNVACTWHPQGGSYGTIVAVIGRRADSNVGAQMCYVLINCDYLITGKGDLFRGSGPAEGVLVMQTATDGFNNFANDTGTLLDVSAGGTNSRIGFVMSTGRHQILGSNGSQVLCRYSLARDGKSFTETKLFQDQHSGFSTKDSNAKSRVLPVSDSQYVTVNASSSTDFGLVVKHRQQIAWVFAVLADVRLDAQALTTMPAPSSFSAANNWDALYNPLDNKVWVYYFDKNNAQRLMRTAVDLNTGQATKEEIEVNATVGATGTENRAIRVHRHHTIGEQILITVANRTSGGTHTNIYVTDVINVAPSQPTLVAEPNFDATAANQFQWTFKDLNTSDFQTFYRLTIDNATTGASAWVSDPVQDNFTRSVTGGWGNATTGQAWTASGGTVSTDYDTTGNVGRHVHTSRDIFRITTVPSFTTTDVDMTVTVTNPVVPTGDGIWAYFMARVNATVDQYYFARLYFSTGGTAELSIRKRTPSETLLATAATTMPHVAGQSYKVRLRVQGSNIMAKAWRTQDTEPINWDVSVVDTSLTAAGSIGCRSYTSATNTNTLPVIVTWDDLAVMAGSATGSYTLPANSITNGNDYRWRVMTWDSHAASSPWSDYGFFTTSNTGVVTITDPAVDNDPNIVTANYLVKWSVANTTQNGYNIVVTRVDTGATLISTGWVTSTSTQYLVQGMTSDIQWNVAVKIRNAALIESNTANRKITPNYNKPEVPIVTFDVLDDSGYIQLNITNPDPVGDRPTPTANEIHRRVYNADDPTTPWQVLGTADPSTAYQDFTAASGVIYEYRVRALAGQYFQDSTFTSIDAALSLTGVWMHDPTDSPTTLRQFQYGKDQRSTAIDTVSTVQQFAGRVFPVTDFGEHEQEDVTVSVDIPDDETHYTVEADLRKFMEMKRTLFYKDNRGRALYGTMSGYNQADQAWGVTVGFKFSRVDYDITVVN